MVNFHHILPKSKYPQYTYDENNIVLLTWEVHDQVERNIDLTPKVKALTQKLLNKHKMSQEQEQKVEQRELTFGEDLVGIGFNPSGMENVDRTKREIAGLMDMVKEASASEGKATYTQNLLYGDAIRDLLRAQMAVVKYLTYVKK